MSASARFRLSGPPIRYWCMACTIAEVPGRIVSVEKDSDSAVHRIVSDISTTSGTAGGPLVDLQTGRVLGIHYGGQWGDNKGKFALASAFGDLLNLSNLPSEIKLIFSPPS